MCPDIVNLWPPPRPTHGRWRSCSTTWPATGGWWTGRSRSSPRPSTSGLWCSASTPAAGRSTDGATCGPLFSILASPVTSSGVITHGLEDVGPGEVDVWPDEVVVFDPRAGAVRGHRQLRQFVRRRRSLLTERRRTAWALAAGATAPAGAPAGRGPGDGLGGRVVAGRRYMPRCRRRRRGPPTGVITRSAAIT